MGKAPQISVLALTLLAAYAQAERALMPGDWIEVRCAEDASLASRLPLSPTGTIEIPGLVPINVAKLEPAAAADKIAQTLLRVGRVSDPHVVVRLVEGHRSTVTISGLVRHPGPIFVGPETTLRDVLNEADPNTLADLQRVHVYKAGGGEEFVDATGPAWRVRGGDRVEVLLIASRREVFVLGGVLRPGAVAYEPGLTIEKALAAAGGITPNAEPMRIQVVREGFEPRPIDLATDGSLTLKPGDTLQVALREDRRYLAVSGAVRHPGQVPYRDFFRLSELIRAVGGANWDADLEHIEIKIVADGSVRRANLAAILKGKETDPVVKLGETVIVPRLRVRTGP